ncbi:XRE family transcriptional regulator [Flavobacterium arcticum]|uniref:XRE family transcriptional regulator n=1 Tax=Flavobacterium arcticum TaxID=1784713 RepID=A0A345HB29_9FLAO|nr:helix-turn-helix transcriptional regulator [Flavobacterium arcticum]AXG73789.1 XRE family transcriptional regulator [Flavobacterium arcticum]KAF2511741.1 helix-turn-helix transcriptional regulator [Flavobacterium arcticum]
MFGKNLKKIRSVHGMSQQEFAELFDLKRATLGAYEENRSNPKLETVVKIAKHFSISIDDLLTRELTVNRLLRFNETITVIPGETQDNDKEGITCISENNKEDFIKQYNIANNISNVQLPSVYLPHVSGTHKLALVIDDLTMSGEPNGFLPKDMVIGTQIPLDEIEKTNGELVLIATANDFYFRKINYQNDKVVLKANHPGVEPIALNTKEITGLWVVVHLFRYTLPSNESELEQRLAQLESSIANLRQNPE